MRQTVFVFLLFAAAALTYCSNSPVNNHSTADSSKDSVKDSVVADTLVIKDTVATNQNKLRSVSAWSVADFITSERYKTSPSVRQTIEYTIEEWKNVKSPFVAKYTGCDVGDYFHLNFHDADGKNYDFGFGNNQFGEYDLCDKDINDNPKYLGESFLIYWNWEISKFPCCDGEYDIVEAYMPSVTKLELSK